MRRWRPRRTKFEQRDGKWQPVLLEEHVLREIVERLWLQASIKVWRINQPVGGKTPQNESGIPDLMGWAPISMPCSISEGTMHDSKPRPLFIEVKRPKGAAHRAGVRSPAQIRFIDEAREAGCIAFFAESWQQCVDEFAKFGIKLTGDTYGTHRVNQGCGDPGHGLTQSDQ